MSLQVLQRLSDYNKEVKHYIDYNINGVKLDLSLPDYYIEFNAINKPGLKEFDFNALRDYAIFIY